MAKESTASATAVETKDEESLAKANVLGRLDRLEKNQRELIKHVRKTDVKLSEAFRHLEEFCSGAFGLGGLAHIFNALKKGFKSE